MSVFRVELHDDKWCVVGWRDVPVPLTRQRRGCTDEELRVWAADTCCAGFDPGTYAPGDFRVVRSERPFPTKVWMRLDPEPINDNVRRHENRLLEQATPEDLAERAALATHYTYSLDGSGEPPIGINVRMSDGSLIEFEARVRMRPYVDLTARKQSK